MKSLNKVSTVSKFSKSVFFIFTCIITLLFAGSLKAEENTKGVGFSFGGGFYQVIDDRRKIGDNINLSMRYTLDETDQASIYFESLDINSAGEVIEAIAVPSEVKVETDISIRIFEFRLIRTIIADLLNAGIGIGAAHIETVSGSLTTPIAVGAPPAFFNLAGSARDKTVVPVVDLFGRVFAFRHQGKRKNASIHFDLGYRFMDIDDLNVAQQIGYPDSAIILNDVIIEDLSGIFANIGISADF